MWDVRYWDGPGSKVEKWMDKLPPEKLKGAAKALIALSKCGNTLKLPQSKSLGDGLFELRERKYGLRLYYMFRGNKVVILLQGGDKSTQEKDIKIARKRMLDGR